MGEPDQRPDHMEFFQTSSWCQTHSPYSLNHCCRCGKPTGEDPAYLNLTRTADGNWWMIAPGSPVLRDEGMDAINRNTTRERVRLPIGAECLKACPKWAIVALLCLAASLPALDWSAYDKQLHAASGALGAYVISDVLECTTDLPPWARWLISTGTMAAAGWMYEELNGNGLREANDAHATTMGAMVGAMVHGGVSFFLTNDGGAVGYSVRF